MIRLATILRSSSSPIAIPPAASAATLVTRPNPRSQPAPLRRHQMCSGLACR